MEVSIDDILEAQMQPREELIKQCFRVGAKFEVGVINRITLKRLCDLGNGKLEIIGGLLTIEDEDFRVTCRDVATSIGPVRWLIYRRDGGSELFGASVGSFLDEHRRNNIELSEI